MSDLRSLVIKNGTTQNISNSDTLIVGTKVDAAAGQALSIGDVNATGITIGKVGVTTSFPGPVALDGDVTTVGGTTFTTDATFEGNVTFGAGPADTVTFAALTTVVSDINFGGAPGTYKITNLANGTNPNDAVNFSQLSAIVSGVSSFQTSLSGLTPSSATGGAITLAGTLGVASGGTGATTLTSGSLLAGNGTGAVAEIAPGANGQVLTVVSGAWASAAPAVTATAQGGANAVQYANATTPADFDGDNTKLAFDEATSQLSVGTGTANETLTVNGRVSIAEGAVPTNTAGFGKLWAESVDKTLHFYDNSIDYLVTPNTVATLTYAASVALDFAPSLPPIKSVSLTGDITFTTSNLLASRNISVRVVGDTVSRNLVFPAGWKWLGGVTPTVLEANKTAILSLAAFSGVDAGIVASWSYDGSDVVTDVTALAPLASSGGSTPQISLTGVVGVTNGGTGQSSYVNGELLIGNTTGNTLTKSTLTAGSGVSITNGAGSITIAATGSGGTVTSVGLSTTLSGITVGSSPVTTSGTITLSGTLGVTSGGTGTTTQFTQGSVVFAGASGVYEQDNANLFWDNTNDRLGIGIAVPTASLHVAGTVLAKNAANSTAAFDVQNAAAASQLRVDTTNSKLFFAGVATTNTHTVNIGTSGTDPAFAIAAGGRIHYYDGSQPTNGQVLIGDTAAGNFAKAALTAGSGVSITNGAGSITISATGAAAPVIDLTTTGLTAGDVAYVSSNDTASAAIATAAATARCAGLVSVVGGAGVGKVQVGNVYIGANFITGLTGLAAGQQVYLSKTLGKLTNDVSAFVSGDVVAEVGIATSVSSATGGAAAANVLWQPKSIVVL